MLQNLLGMTGDALDGMDFDVGLGGDDGSGSSSGMNDMLPTDTGLVGGGGMKRGRDDEGDAGLSAKRSRFEVVE